MPHKLTACLAFVNIVIATAVFPLVKAGEPTARELVALAPVLHSADPACHNLVISGIVGGTEKTLPRWRFRACYKAPNQYSLLVSDPVDGTPMVFASGNKMLVYDPVDAIVYYSERASFSVDLICNENGIDFKVVYLLVSNKETQISINLRSFMKNMYENNKLVSEHISRISNSLSKVDIKFESGQRLDVNLDLSTKGKYTSVSMYENEVNFLFLDMLEIDRNISGESFGFPDKQTLTKSLPIKDVESIKDIRTIQNIATIVGRATIARPFINGSMPPSLMKDAGIAGISLSRLKENDKKYGTALIRIIPVKPKTDRAGKQGHF